jgi:hypothetical protein
MAGGEVIVVARLELDIESSLPPQRVIDALIDFSDRRPDIWPGLAREFYEVYSVGDTTAEVREGSVMPGLKIWAREHYDWSRPGVVSWTVTESNFCTPGSGVITEVTPRDGGSRLHVSWERTGSNPKGRMIVAMMKLTRGRLIVQSVRSALDKLARAEP